MQKTAGSRRLSRTSASRSGASQRDGLAGVALRQREEPEHVLAAGREGQVAELLRLPAAVSACARADSTRPRWASTSAQPQWLAASAFHRSAPSAASSVALA